MSNAVDQARHAHMNACAARDVAYDAYIDARRTYSAARREYDKARKASEKALDAYIDARWPAQKDDAAQ